MPYITSPDPEFTAQLNTMEAASTAAAQATMLVGQRQWMYPPLQGWNGDPYTITDMNKAFTRNNLNTVYQQILLSTASGVGTVGEAMVAKLQVDYIAALERAFRTRHCSSVRARIHAAGRRQGQGLSTGVFSGNVLLWIERLIYAAHPN